MFATVEDGQKEVRVEVYQGESHELNENILVGDFVISGLDNVPAGNLMVLHFDLDLNGLLKVTSTEKRTGLSKTVIMDTRGKATLNLDEARKNIAELTDAGDSDAGEDVETDLDESEIVESAPQNQDPASANPEAEPIEGSNRALLATARDLRKRAETMLQKNISPEDAQEIRDLVHTSIAAVKERNWKTLEEKNDSLSDLLFYMED